METETMREEIRHLIVELLKNLGKDPAFSDEDSLIQSGRLDSLATMKLVMTLESKYQMKRVRGVSDLQDIDTLSKILARVSQT